MVARVERIAEIGSIRRRFGAGDLVGSVGVSEITSIQTGFGFSVTHAIALHLFGIFGTQIIFEAVEGPLRQENLLPVQCQALNKCARCTYHRHAQSDVALL